MRKRLRPPAAALVGALCLCIPAIVRGQTGGGPGGAPSGQGGFPDATFDATFRKYTPPDNVFSPFYSWDARMVLAATLVRHGSNAVALAGMFQTVGTENLGPRVSVGGSGYLLDLGYAHTYTGAFTLSTGLKHFSSHLTRDLDEKTDEERSKGDPIPIVDDPSEFNVFFVEAQVKLPAYPLSPQFDVIVEPINFQFNGTGSGNARPVYLGTRFALWRGAGTSLVAETRHEIGARPFNYFSLVLGLYARDQPEGRLQIFVDASPGHTLHVSPNIGALRDGIAVGLRMYFRTTSP